MEYPETSDLLRNPKGSIRDTVLCCLGASSVTYFERKLDIGYRREIAIFDYDMLERQCKLLTFALKTPRLIGEPAQLRISVANKLGSGLSCACISSSVRSRARYTFHAFTYNRASINANDEVEPRVQGHLWILISEHLEAVRAFCRGVLVLRRCIQPRDEAIQGTKHCRHDVRIFGLVRIEV